MAKTPNDLVADRARTHMVALARFDNGEQRRMDKIIRRMWRDLSKLYHSKDFGKRTPTQQKRIKEFLKVARETIRKGYQGINQEFTPTLKELADLELNFTVDSINAVYGEGFVETTFTASQVNAAVRDTLIVGANKKQWMERLAGNDLAAFTSEIQQGVIGGKTNAAMVQNLQGIAQKSRNHLNTFVRTAVQKVANDAAEKVYADNEEVVEFVQQISTLDSRTSDICMAYSGEVWTNPDHKPMGPKKLPYNDGIPRHPNCRSRIIPIVKQFRELQEDGTVKDVSGLPKRTRAAVTQEGKGRKFTVKDLPVDTTFDEFLKSASPSTQKALLGPGKLKLWKAGKIDTKDLVNAATGRPFTLEQLKRNIARK